MLSGTVCAYNPGMENLTIDRSQNLNLYLALSADLSIEDRSILDIGMIGALSAVVDDAAWQRAMKIAQQRLIDRAKQKAYVEGN